MTWCWQVIPDLGTLQARLSLASDFEIGSTSLSRSSASLSVSSTIPFLSSTNLSLGSTRLSLSSGRVGLESVMRGGLGGCLLGYDV